MKSDKKIIDKQVRLYEEALSHYKNCQYRQEEVSDTWSSAFDRKGRLYSIDEMIQMFAPESKVSALIVNWNYFVDSKVYDLANPTISKLLEGGESDFGHPRKEVTVGGKNFSSHFLRKVWIAAKIIRLIENSGLETPRVMEIGGGTGMLQFLLKKYFGEKLTLFAVDLPETLLIQEWYLRNRFPDVAYIYKGSNEKKDFLEGGFNFINAFTLKSQDIAIDVAINIASMQEMTADVANEYIKYIERNICENGFFFFKNTYGHSRGSVPEPSEYNFDPYWSIELASISYPVEMNTVMEYMVFALRRGKNSYNPKVRKYIMRFLWNSFLAGIFPRNSKVTKESILLLETESTDELLERLKEITEKHKLPLNFSEISALISNIHFPSKSYIKISDFYKRTECDKKDAIDCIMKSFWFVQSGLIELMYEAPNSIGLKDTDTIKSKIKEACTHLFDKIKSDYISSEYLTAYVCSMLFALGQSQQAVELAKLCTENSKNNFWLIRFAHLLSEFGFSREAYKVIKQVPGDKNEDLLLNLKKIEILYHCGDIDQANKLTDIFAKKREIPEITKQVFAKTAIRVGRLDIAKDICFSSVKFFGQKSFESLVDILFFLLSNQKDDEALSFVGNFKDFFTTSTNTPDRKLEYGCLLSKSGRNNGALSLILLALKSLQDSYFKMAWAGRLLQEAGLYELSQRCLERSVKLRPKNFKHSKFVADTYLAGHRFQNALVHYREAAALKPYIRNVRYKEAYCGLPEDFLRTNLFGRPSDIDLICQEYPHFYHDIEPHMR